nr:uncharacterized protein LOC101236217 [Hydra vulgaris]
MAILSGSEAVTKLLIKNSANVYVKDSEGKGPIHYAAAINQGKLIVLLTKGALAIVNEENWEDTQRMYVNLRTEKKESNFKKDAAIHIAARAGYLDTVKTLESIGANVNICSGSNSTALHLAAINGDKNMTQYLLERNAKINVYDHQNMAPVHNACKFGRLDILKILMEHGAQIDSKDSNFFTPLMWAVSKGHNDIVEYLLSSGVNVKDSEMNMKNVLHLAIEKHHSFTLQILLKHGGASLVNDPDKDFKRPLHYAAMTNGVESVKMLVENSADITVTDNEEKTALHTAAEYGNFKCLVTLVQNSSRNINGTDEKGRSPLHLAAYNGWVKTTITLIEMGAQISSCDDSSWTPLDYAVSYGYTKIALKLINNGANVNRYDANLVTPLHRASFNGQVDCINVLLSNGASISFKNKDGKNCLDLAVENHHKEACMIFIMHERWEEALSNIDNEGKNPMEKLISFAPEIAAIVLDKCIKRSQFDKSSKEYSISYNFKYLDFPPDHHLRKQYFGPSSMIAFNCENLLSHSLTVQLLKDKWLRLGWWIHLISLFIYILFVCLLTSVLLVDKISQDKAAEEDFSCSDLDKTVFNKSVSLLEISRLKNEAQKFKNEKGILAKPEAKIGQPLVDIVKQKVIEVYKTEEFTRHSPGKTCNENQDVNIKFMHRNKLSLRWANDAQSSQCWVPFDKVICQISAPSIKGDNKFVNNDYDIIMSYVSFYIKKTLHLKCLNCHKIGKGKSYDDKFHTIVTLATIVTLFEIGKEFAQACILKEEYLKNLRNYLELILYSSTLVYMMSFIKKNEAENLYDDKNVKWAFGAVSILFAWINLLLYLKRDSFFGIYVIMINEVFKSLVSVITVFCLIILAFSLSFFMLLGNQIAFKYPGRSFMKTISMTLGGSTYDDIFINNSSATSKDNYTSLNVKLPYPIGLAVGDIAIVRKSAYILKLKAQVDILKALESKYPLQLLKKIYCNQVTIYPNKISLKNRILNWFGHSNYSPLKHKQEKSRWKKDVAKELELQSKLSSVRNLPYDSNNDTNDIVKFHHGDDIDTELSNLTFSKETNKGAFDEKIQSKTIFIKKTKKTFIDRIDKLFNGNLNQIGENKNAHDGLSGTLECDIAKNDKKMSIFSLPNHLFDYSNSKTNLKETNEFYNNIEKFSLQLAAKEGAIDRIKEIVTEYDLNKNELYGKTNSAKLLIGKGANVMMQNNNGSTALHYASRRGNKTLVSMILEIPNIDINIPDINLATPLHLAVIGGYECIVDILISYGAEVTARDYKGQGPIHYLAASTTDDIRAEKNKGKNKGCQSTVKKMAIQYVPSSIIGDLIDLLISAACKDVPKNQYEKQKIEFVNSKTVENETPLHIAAYCGNELCLNKLILIGADVNSQTESGSTPLHLAAISGQKRAVNMLLNNNSNIQASDNDLMTPIHRACQYGRLSIVKLLDKKRAMLDIKGKNNYTPIMCAVWKGHVKVIKYLINRGVQINLTDVNNKNVFHIAVQENQFEVLEFLSEQDSMNIINDVDNEYKTPVHYAAAEGSIQALDILIKKNASIDIGELYERTPLHLAAEHGHLSCVKLLISISTAEVNSTDVQGMTPLHLAASNNHKKVVNLLIESGADIYFRDNCDMNPLDYAAQCGHEKIVQILLGNGAFVDACSENGYTPLHHAALSGHVECIVGLLENGANIQLKTKIENKSCLDLAVESLEKEACLAIIKHKRWHEAFVSIDNKETEVKKNKNEKEKERKETCVMEKIIKLAPEIGEVVFNKCITPSKHDKKDPNYFIEYNFEFVDSNPVRCQKQFFAPSSIVNFQRGKLLAHPLVVELINQKWLRMGRWMYLCSFSFYLLFVVLLTTFAVTRKMNQLDAIREQQSYSRNHLSNNQTWCKSLSIKGIYITLSIAIVQVLSQIILSIYIGRSYIFDPTKILDFFLYIATALHLLSLITCKKNIENKFVETVVWQAGTVSILLAWCKFLIYMENLPFLGLYVVMLMEVLYTLIKVLLIFSILLIGFALSFYSLLDCQAPFSDFGHSIIKTFVMMLGEINYDIIYTSHYGDLNINSNGPKSSAELSLLVFILFVLIMLIVMMKLLLGLAVGDIETVRKNAYLGILQRKVYYLNILDQTYPKFIKQYVYQKSYIKKPNKKNWYKKVMLWLETFHKKVLLGDQGEAKKDSIMRVFAANKKDIMTQNKKTKLLLDDLQKQLKKNKKITKHILPNFYSKNSTD